VNVADISIYIKMENALVKTNSFLGDSTIEEEEETDEEETEEEETEETD
jgi:hypothetical protein